MSPRRTSRPEVLASGPEIPLKRTAVATLDTEPATDSPACCPRFHEAVELVGKRWTGAILAVLLQGGPMRFSEIAQAVPALSDRLLSERVKELENRGMVERRVGGASPARVEYDLTPMGRDLAPALSELEAWAHRCRRRLGAAAGGALPARRPWAPRLRDGGRRTARTQAPPLPPAPPAHPHPTHPAPAPPPAPNIRCLRLGLMGRAAAGRPFRC